MENFVELTGFREIDEASMEIIKKLVDNYAKKISTLAKMENLHITLKPIHEREKSEKYEVHVNVKDGKKIYSSHTVGRNLLSAVDDVLKKLINELHHMNKK